MLDPSVATQPYVQLPVDRVEPNPRQPRNASAAAGDPAAAFGSLHPASSGAKAAIINAIAADWPADCARNPDIKTMAPKLVDENESADLRLCRFTCAGSALSMKAG